jgi:hypothetical protein
VVVRTSLQRKLGGYREDLPHAGDLEMWLRFAAHGAVAYLAGVDQAYYRRHVASMQATRFNSVLDDLRQRRAAFDAVFDSFGAQIGDAEQLRNAVRRALATEALWTACKSYDRRCLDKALIDNLEAFALETYTAARRLREYNGLRWRRLIGPRWPPLLRPILPGYYVRWIKRQLWWRRLRLRGV